MESSFDTRSDVVSVGTTISKLKIMSAESTVKVESIFEETITPTVTKSLKTVQKSDVNRLKSSATRAKTPSTLHNTTSNLRS